MNINFGSQKFQNVEVPVLWGNRAILQDGEGKISIISLEGETAKIEVLGNKPAPNITYEIIDNGFKVIENEIEFYIFYPEKNTISGLAVKLPECEINDNEIRVGTNYFSGNMFYGFGVGIIVSENGIGMGAPLPEKLAKLIV